MVVLVTAGYDHTIRYVFTSSLAEALELEGANSPLLLDSGRPCLESVHVPFSTLTPKSIVSAYLPISVS